MSCSLYRLAVEETQVFETWDNMLWWTANRLKRQDLGFTDWVWCLCHSWILHFVYHNTSSYHTLISPSWLLCMHILYNIQYMRGIYLLEQYDKRVESIFCGICLLNTNQKSHWLLQWGRTIEVRLCPSDRLPGQSMCCLCGFILWSVVKTHLPLPTLKWALSFLSC